MSSMRKRGVYIVTGCRQRRIRRTPPPHELYELVFKRSATELQAPSGKPTGCLTGFEPATSTVGRFVSSRRWVRRVRPLSVVPGGAGPPGPCELPEQFHPRIGSRGRAGGRSRTFGPRRMSHGQASLYALGVGHGPGEPGREQILDHSPSSDLGRARLPAGSVVRFGSPQSSAAGRASHRSGF